MLKLLLNPRAVEIAGYVLFFMTPALAIALYYFWKSARYFLKGSGVVFLLGGSGPLIVLLWLVHNAIMNALGSDSLLGMLMNLFLFCLLGLGGGYFLRRMIRANISPVTATLFQPIDENDREEGESAELFDSMDLSSAGKALSTPAKTKQTRESERKG
jgi:hypothetical protein